MWQQYDFAHSEERPQYRKSILGLFYLPQMPSDTKCHLTDRCTGLLVSPDIRRDLKKSTQLISINRQITRREFLLLGLGVSVLQASTRVSATGKANLQPTPNQTAGPFFPNQPQADRDTDLTQVAGREGRAEGDVIQVSGQVLSTGGDPIEGVLIDIWQANTWGRYAHSADRNSAPIDENFQGWGQMRTDANGHYRFKTIVPGPYPVSRSWSRPPHIHFKLSKPGYHTLTTQMYFSGHPLNEKDNLLLQHTPSERKNLVVDISDDEQTNEGSSIRSGEFNIVLNGVG